MVTLSGGLQDVLDQGSDLLNRFSAQPVVAAIGGALAGGAVVGAVSTAIASSSSSTRKTNSKKRKSTSSKKRKSKKRNYKYARTAGKGKDRSTRRIRMTKNGQPYVILKSGKAKFISKKSAHLSRKRKGGRY